MPGEDALGAPAGQLGGQATAAPRRVGVGGPVMTMVREHNSAAPQAVLKGGV